MAVLLEDVIHSVPVQTPGITRCHIAFGAYTWQNERGAGEVTCDRCKALFASGMPADLLALRKRRQTLRTLVKELDGHMRSLVAATKELQPALRGSTPSGAETP